MFTLAEVEDTVRLPPDEWDDEVEAIKSQINKKFSNKIIDKVGLCVQLFDLLSIEPGFIYQGDGSQYVQVRFRLIVFSPLVGEVLEGTVVRSTPSSIQVSLGFFDQIYIPSSLMQDDTIFKDTGSERTWVWMWNDHELAFVDREPIRFRVQSVKFTSPSHSMSKRRLASEQDKPATADASGKSKNEAQPPKTIFEMPNHPLVILGSVHEMGLGLVKWWAEGDTSTGEKSADHSLDKSIDSAVSLSDKEDESKTVPVQSGQTRS